MSTSAALGAYFVSDICTHHTGIDCSSGIDSLDCMFLKHLKFHYEQISHLQSDQPTEHSVFKSHTPAKAYGIKTERFTCFISYKIFLIKLKTFLTPQSVKKQAVCYQNQSSLKQEYTGFLNSLLNADCLKVSRHKLSACIKMMESSGLMGHSRRDVKLVADMEVWLGAAACK